MGGCSGPVMAHPSHLAPFLMVMGSFHGVSSCFWCIYQISFQCAQRLHATSSSAIMSSNSSRSLVLSLQFHFASCDSDSDSKSSDVLDLTLFYTTIVLCWWMPLEWYIHRYPPPLV